MDKIKLVLPIIITTIIMIGLVRYESSDRYIKKENISKYVESIQKESGLSKQ